MKYIIIILLGIVPAFLIAQSTVEEHIDNKIRTIYNEYNAVIKNESTFIVGKPVGNINPQGKGHAFYGDGNWMKATLHCNGVAFKTDYLRYDLKNSRLISLQFSTSGAQYIELFQSNIQSFEIDNKTFRYIDRSVFPGKHKLESKYYEVLYQNDKILLVKNWQKSQTGKKEDAYAIYSDVSSLLIVKDDKLYKVNTKEAFFEIFTKKELTRIENYVNSKRYNFKDNIAQEIADILAYYCEKII